MTGSPGRGEDHRGGLVVGIGASAGGLGAFKRFFGSMPADSGMSFILIQHLDPQHESLMAELISRHSDMPVTVAEHEQRIEPNRVYMIPPNRSLRLRKGRIVLDEPVQERGVRMPIDTFFRSLAEDARDRAVAIILSGTGSDGTLGLEDIKGAGGLVIVEDPESAEHDGMPRSARRTGLVDYVLPIEEIPAALVKYSAHPFVEGSGEKSLDEAEPNEFQAVLGILRTRTEHDFSCYKRGTLLRRLQRRMSLCHVSTLAEYLELLRVEPREWHALYKDLLIGVTRFFRDPEVWEALAAEVAPDLLDRRERAETLRVWVPGCATGEEAYTVAMVLLEAMGPNPDPDRLQIFATDIDEDALAIARDGYYPSSIAVDLSPDRLARFFEEDEERYRASEALRSCVVFAAQNLVGDPPFSKLDLICCRNLLIYLEPAIQRRARETFHFALADHGYLVLGTSESVIPSSDLFEPVRKSARIFRKLPNARTRVGARPGRARISAPPPGEAAKRAARPGDERRLLTERAQSALLDRFAPAAVVIDREGEVIYFQGPVRRYLDFPRGQPTADLLSMAPSGLVSKLRGLVHRAQTTDAPVEGLAPRVAREDGAEWSVRVRVEPLADPDNDEPLLLVSFRDEGSTIDAEDRAALDLDQEQSDLIAQLETELETSRADLQRTIEELETSNEELEASNEEAMSMNEELQSTNEELETSREELQSLNEELTTVNSQLEDKISELEEVNDDLRNLLSSTRIATLFLDSELNIRRFTPATSEVVRIIPSDVGRPLSDLSFRAEDPDLAEDARTVLTHLRPVEREISRSDGTSFLRRVLPFRTSNDRIDGVVVTFAEVTQLKETQERLEARERQQAAVAELGNVALRGNELQEVLDKAVEAVSETLDNELCKVLEYRPEQRDLFLRAGVGWNEGLVGSGAVPAGIDSQGGYTLQSRTAVVVEDLRTEKRFAGPALLTDHRVVSGVSVIIGTVDEPWGVLGTHTREPRAFTIDDVHFVQAVANVLLAAIRHRSATEELARSNERLALALDSGGLGIWDWDLENDELSWDGRYHEIFGIDDRSQDPSPEVWRERVHPEDLDRVERAVAESRESGAPYSIEYRVLPGDGQVRWVESRGHHLFDAHGAPVRMTGVVLDITARKLAEAELGVSEGRLRVALANAPLLMFHTDTDLRYTWVSSEHPTMPGGEVVGRRDDQIFEPEAASRLLELKHTSMESGDGKRAEVVLRGEPTAVVWDVLVEPLLDETGACTGLIGAALDVSDAHEAKRRLESAARQKDEFLALLGHELRNPLAAVTTALELLRHPPDADAFKNAVAVIERQGRQLRRLVDDLLQVSRITRGDIEIRPAAVNVADALQGVLATFGDRLSDREIETDLQKDLIAWVDPTRLEQILSNLIANAIKYSEAGTPIRIAGHRSSGAIALHVADEGVGMSAETLASVFDPFVRGPESPIGSDSGLGIGLTLAAKLAEIHGGRLRAESPGLDQGSTFVVELPAATREQRARGAEPKETEGEPLARTSHRLLIVDDNEDLAEGLDLLLSRAGLEVRRAGNGRDGIELARSWEPDAILLDIGLPDISGHVVAERVRAEQPQVRLVAISGFKPEEDEEALFDRYFVKPVDIDDIIEVLDGSPAEE